MKKLSKLLKAFTLLIKQPSLINYVLESDEVWENYIITNNLGDTELLVVDIEEVIPNFNETLDYFTFLGGGSIPTDIMLLKALAKQINDCNYFEIGTWRGESVVNVAQIAKECYTLNLSKQELQELKLPKKFADVQGFFSKGVSNIVQLEGNSLKFDFKGLNQKFDLIFIDGNHTFEYIKADTQNVFKHLMHDNTIVVWHDYAYTPEKLRPEVLSAIYEGVPKDLHPHLYHVSNTMCAIYTKQKVNTKVFEGIKTPDKVFKVTAEVKSI